MIRVAIADDQAMVRAGFRMIVESQTDMRIAGEAGDGQEAIDLVNRERPDVILMDVRMPRLDGIAATRQVADITRVVILTTYELDEYVFDALAAGASAFLLKAAPPEDLIKAIRVVASGDALLAPSVTRRLIQEFAKRPEPQARKAIQLESLTDRERDVLREVARGLSNRQIAGQMYLSIHTIAFHLRRIYC